MLYRTTRIVPISSANMQLRPFLYKRRSQLRPRIWYPLSCTFFERVLGCSFRKSFTVRSLTGATRLRAPFSSATSLLALSLPFRVSWDQDAMTVLSWPPMRSHCARTSSTAPYPRKISTQSSNMRELTPFGTPPFFFPCWPSFSLRSSTVSNGRR